MHGKAAETQVLISTDWIANISICGVALFISEAIDRHHKKLHAILEIIIHMWSGGPVDVKIPFAEGLRAGLVAGVLVSVFQTVTSIQDNVLAFIPRAAAIFVVFALTFPWMLRLLAGFTERIVLRLPEMVR